MQNEKTKNPVFKELHSSEKIDKSYERKLISEIRKGLIQNPKSALDHNWNNATLRAVRIIQTPSKK